MSTLAVLGLASLGSIGAMAGAAGIAATPDRWRARLLPLLLAFSAGSTLAAAFLVWVLIWRTRRGYEMRTLGFSPGATRYAGISEPPYHRFAFRDGLAAAKLPEDCFFDNAFDRQPERQGKLRGLCAEINEQI